MASNPSARTTTPANTTGRVLYRPDPKDEAEVRRAFEDADRGEVFDAETTEAYLRWLETGEGPCPWTDGSQG